MVYCTGLVVHLKHAHALVLALALAFAHYCLPYLTYCGPHPHLVSSCALLSPSCICAQEGSIHIHAYPSPSPRLLLHPPRAASVTHPSHPDPGTLQPLLPFKPPCCSHTPDYHPDPHAAVQGCWLHLDSLRSPFALFAPTAVPDPTLQSCTVAVAVAVFPPPALCPKQHTTPPHRRNGRRETPARLPDVAVHDLGTEPTHLSPFASRHARSGILDLSLSLAQSFARHQSLRCNAATTRTPTTAAVGHAAVAIDA